MRLMKIKQKTHGRGYTDNKTTVREFAEGECTTVVQAHDKALCVQITDINEKGEHSLLINILPFTHNSFHIIVSEQGD